MASLKPIHWKRFEKFLIFIGCGLEREKGDHRIYWRKGLKRPVVIPNILKFWKEFNIHN